MVIFVASIIQEVENVHTITHNITEILLMLALSTNQSNNHACRVIDHLMKIDRTIIHLFSVSDSSVSCDIVRRYLFSHFNYNIYVSIYFRSTGKVKKKCICDKKEKTPICRQQTNEKKMHFY